MLQSLMDHIDQKLKKHVQHMNNYSHSLKLVMATNHKTYCVVLLMKCWPF